MDSRRDLVHNGVSGSISEHARDIFQELRKQDILPSTLPKSGIQMYLRIIEVSFSYGIVKASGPHATALGFASVKEQQKRYADRDPHVTTLYWALRGENILPRSHVSTRGNICETIRRSAIAGVVEGHKDWGLLNDALLTLRKNLEKANRKEEPQAKYATATA